MRAAIVWLLGLAVCTLPAVPDAPGATRTPSPSLRVESAWARQALRLAPQPGQPGPGTGNGAIYVTLRNAGAVPDTLLGASSPAAEHVELHETLREGAIMRMRPVAALTIPAGAVLEMKPGGIHIMLIDLKRDLRPGDRIPVTLRFARAAPLSLDVPVR